MANFYLTNDLLFSSPALGVAERLGKTLRLISSEQALLSAAQEAGCHFVLLDLSLPGCQPNVIVAQLKTTFPTVKIVAYAPHVHVALMQSAVDAGCNEVLTRGQFHAQLPRLLEQYLQ